MRHGPPRSSRTFQTNIFSGKNGEPEGTTVSYLKPIPMGELCICNNSPHMRKEKGQVTLRDFRLLVLQILIQLACESLWGLHYRRLTPSAQRSTDWSCPLLKMNSGARYSGVPHIVCDLGCICASPSTVTKKGICFANPMSIILKYPVPHRDRGEVFKRGRRKSGHVE